MRSTATRQTVHFTIHPKPSVKAEIERIAQAEGLTSSRTASAALEDWLARRSHVQHAGIFQPMIEHAIAKEMRAYSSRIAALIVRDLFITEQTRAIAYNILKEQRGMTADKLTDIMDGAKDTAKRNIRRADPELEPIMQQLEQWFTQGVGAAHD